MCQNCSNKLLNIEVSLQCSCCGVSFENKFCPRDTYEGNLIIDSGYSNSALGFENENEIEMICEVYEGYFPLSDRKTEDFSVSISSLGLKESTDIEETEATNGDSLRVITNDEAANQDASAEIVPKDFVVDRIIVQVEEEHETSHHQDQNLPAQLDGGSRHDSFKEEMYIDEQIENAVSDVPPVCEEAQQNPTSETDSEVSIGTEIPDLDSTNNIQSQVHDDSIPATTFTSFPLNNHHDREEYKFPDTPTSIEGFKKFGLLERRESGTEESLDGSIISELESYGDGVLSVERLVSALRAERKNLQNLYVELEEERSASAIAANQTMAMINRLQEEKAAVQMEASQYQRMMEEQSEYDQEALQLMNELVVKREIEKQELERELEVYRRKIFDYEYKENIKISRTSSCSTNEDDNNKLYVDLDEDPHSENGFYENRDLYTPLDTVIQLEESLSEFDEERDSILEQLRLLESKLFTVRNGSDQEHFHDNEKNFFLQRIMGPKPKRLLPLFDAISEEHVDGTSDLEINARFEVEENKREGIEGDVEQLNERLQALEADKEFLKHCIISLKKGDKGIDILQEILQHLRDLSSK
jgi:hypothetical protein